MRSTFLKGSAFFSVLVIVGLAGCGGSSTVTPVAQDPTAPRGTSAGSPPGLDGGGVVPGEAQPRDPNVFNVTMYTSGAIVYVDDLELEWNRRRGIHAFYGFREDNFTQVASIPWEQIRRVDIDNTVGDYAWEQIQNRREDQSLEQSTIFEVRITYRDLATERFYAIIPKFRGWQNGQLWELGMANNGAGIIYMEFDR